MVLNSIAFMIPSSESYVRIKYEKAEHVHEEDEKKEGDVTSGLEQHCVHDSKF